ncbi:hypothetical protein [Maioricimonas sp. JC845]|uniref:hypothetical protein n=1 Tax=Maioricimonas sp. JC845 TaxID=3232138 RepID=UPI0034579901
MAIQFNCPHCTSSVRVGDEAAGKIGRCPKCNQRLRIPQVAPPAAPPAHEPPAPAEPPAVPPVRPLPVGPSDDDGAIGAFPDLTAGPVTPTPDANDVPAASLPDGTPIIAGSETTSYARRLKQKRRSSGWMIPILLGSVLVMAAFVYWKMTQVTATGPLPCTVLPDEQTLQITLDVTEYGVPPETGRLVVDHLREQPARLVTDLMITEFSGNARGLQITLSPGVNGRLVQVPILKNQAVAEFYADNVERLNKPRQSELKTAVQQFCEVWANAAEAGMNPRELSDFRNRLAMTAMVRGLGYHVNGVVDRRRYPCVHEDTDSRLHFMLPQDAEKFEIIARPFEDRRPVLPEPFGFEVRIPAETPQTATDDTNEPDADAEETEEDAATDAAEAEQPDEPTMPADADPDEDGTSMKPGMNAMDAGGSE